MMPFGAPNQGSRSMSFTTLSTTGRLVPEAGLEPARSKEHMILSHRCLPFHHSGKCRTFRLRPIGYPIRAALLVS